MDQVLGVCEVGHGKNKAVDILGRYLYHMGAMIGFSTRQAARKLGVSHAALVRYMATGKIPTPEAIHFGKFRAHLWTEAEVEEVRKLLPKIANGRKTRWEKQRLALSSQQSAKTEAPARVPVPQKARKTRKKK